MRENARLLAAIEDNLARRLDTGLFGVPLEKLG